MTSNLGPLPSFDPPGFGCFWNWTVFHPVWEIFETNNCSVSNDMVDFLNLTGPELVPYFQAYCLNPPGDDNCPFGFCPNPDIAGPFVRVASYITATCYTVIMFYSSEAIQEAFWNQMLITDSLLLTCMVSIAKGQLTRFHLVTVISIVFSPVNFYLTIYAIRAFRSKQAVFGKEGYLKRVTVLLSAAAWIGLLICVYLPQRYIKFSQVSCRSTTFAESFFLVAPFIFAWVFAGGGLAGFACLFAYLVIPILVALGWAMAIFQKRRIWQKSTPLVAMICSFWDTVVKEYPSLRFWTLVVIPTGYWILIIECGAAFGNDDQVQLFSLSFGQILAGFAAIPPVIDVLNLVPGLATKWVFPIILSHVQATGKIIFTGRKNSQDLVPSVEPWLIPRLPLLSLLSPLYPITLPFPSYGGE